MTLGGRERDRPLLSHWRPQNLIPQEGQHEDGAPRWARERSKENREKRMRCRDAEGDGDGTHPLRGETVSSGPHWVPCPRQEEPPR